MAAVLGNNPFKINEWRVDPDLNRMSRGQQTIKVDPQNMKVLELLASRPGEVFSLAQIEESGES
jgi:DNA-binding winged helix-turn-helix (wHTH) protein